MCLCLLATGGLVVLCSVSRVVFIHSTVSLRKKLTCNWRSLNYGRFVARIRELAFWITQRVYTYVLSYVQ